MDYEQNMIKSSFFDTIPSIPSKKSNTQSPNLWLTEEEFSKKHKTQFTKINKGSVLYSGVMCKQDSNAEINEYYYKLYDKYLVQYKLNSAFQRSKILWIMELKFVKMDFEEEFNDAQNELPFFLFSRDKAFEILVPTTTPSFHEWKNLLSSRCILTNFGKYYENLKIIGKGTFAKVILCRRNSDEKKFAVKTYNKAKINSSKNPLIAIQGIQNEVKLMQGLNHRSIIRLHEVYEGEFHIYLVLDLLTGGDLYAKLHKIDNYSENKACIILKNLLESLDYLHSLGIMHRDIKPENIILKDDKSETEIILADFGLSEEYGKEEALIFKRCGTPGYVAPEILNNKPYDTQADIFSAGIIFYIILTGYQPFFGDSYDEILNRNKKCNICFEFEKINIQLSYETFDLLKLMLKKDPKERITARQALNHPFFTKFLGNTDKNLLRLPRLSNQGTLKDQQQILKQTKPNNDKYSPSNQLITNSPVVLGNINEISSPFNADSPQILTATPQSEIQNKEKSLFSEFQKEALGKILENENKLVEKIKN